MLIHNGLDNRKLCCVVIDKFNPSCVLKFTQLHKALLLSILFVTDTTGRLAAAILTSLNFWQLHPMGRRIILIAGSRPAKDQNSSGGASWNRQWWGPGFVFRVISESIHFFWGGGRGLKLPVRPQGVYVSHNCCWIIFFTWDFFCFACLPPARRKHHSRQTFPDQ